MLGRRVTQMYVFREFNETHKGLVRSSIVLHLIAVSAVWGAAFLSLNDARAALTTTLAVLLAIHIFHIANLTISYDLALTGKQYFVTLCMTLALALMLLFAYLRSAADVSGWRLSSQFSFGLRSPHPSPSTLISLSHPCCAPS